MKVNDAAHREKVKEFCKSAGKLLNTKSQYLIEKDIYLTLILKELQRTEFHQNMVFKGGTCLAKAYLNYHRFSEDMDFTWRNQKIFEGKSMKQIRKICSKLIEDIGAEIEKIAERYGFDFKLEKHNPHYVQLGGSDKLVTFLVWFDSISGRQSMIKIQINFFEDIEFPIKNKILKPLVSGLPKNEEIYFRDFLEIYENLIYPVYDVREIACEKVRTLLTRKTVKAKDVIDLYFISKNFSINVLQLSDIWVKKTKFAIDNYKKYAQNFKARQDITYESINWKEIESMLLIDIDKKDFERFAEKFLEDLNNKVNTLI